MVNDHSADSTHRPAFIPPEVESVECYGCHEIVSVEDVAEGIDVSGPDEYYPQMKPVCVGCSGGPE